MPKPDNLVALHHQMTGSYVVDAPKLVSQPLDWWALNLIEGLQRDRERLIAALESCANQLADAVHTRYADCPISDSGYVDDMQTVNKALDLLSEILANDAGISGEDGGVSRPEPMIDMMKETMAAIRHAADAACDNAQEAGVTGAINWADLGVVEVRFCIDEQGDGSYDVLIEEAAPGSVDLARYISREIDKLGIMYPVEVRTEW